MVSRHAATGKDLRYSVNVRKTRHLGDRRQAVTPRQLMVFASGMALVVAALWQLETARSGVSTRSIDIGDTPATLYQRSRAAPSPVVIVSHGFAGSRQLMQAFSFHLARGGYRVLAFDALGHGRNPVPMSGDVTAIDGTTALLVAETRRVIEAARQIEDTTGEVALLGHSMASDIVIRAALAEPGVDNVIAISMFSEAVTPEAPARLLVISGEWETRLREVALSALRQVDPDAGEDETATAGEVQRRATVSPNVEHVGVLFSAHSLRASLDWLNAGFGRDAAPATVATGGWILALLIGIVLTFRPLAARLPARPAPQPVTTKRLLLAIGLPMLLTPAIGVSVFRPFLPVLVADYLLLHLALFAAIQWSVLGRWPLRRGELSWPGLVLLLTWGLVFVGLALDRYAASFLPTGQRLLVIAALSVATVPFMLADSLVSGAGTGRWWQRLAPRVALLVSLAIAALLRPEELGFVLLVLPVMLLFFLVHGTLGRALAQRTGVAASGVGLGLILAWALGVSFPFFAAG